MERGNASWTERNREARSRRVAGSTWTGRVEGGRRSRRIGGAESSCRRSASRSQYETRAATSRSRGSPSAPIANDAVPNSPGLSRGTAFGGSSRKNGPWTMRGVITTSRTAASPRFRTVTRYMTRVASKSIPGSTRISGFLGARFARRLAARATTRSTTGEPIGPTRRISASGFRPVLTLHYRRRTGMSTTHRAGPPQMCTLWARWAGSPGSGRRD
ncbi:MAG: hypothetical protein A3K65_02440 [Euryarchaeota archaeon RBG_16_68_12]|nr:MAG: hypothetical protein A3K65_02440 [Euryarchaeota archaeon RBG_16_68_12]